MLGAVPALPNALMFGSKLARRTVLPKVCPTQPQAAIRVRIATWIVVRAGPNVKVTWPHSHGGRCVSTYTANLFVRNYQTPEMLWCNQNAVYMLRFCDCGVLEVAQVGVPERDNVIRSRRFDTVLRRMVRSQDKHSSRGGKKK